MFDRSLAHLVSRFRVLFVIFTLVPLGIAVSAQPALAQTFKTQAPIVYLKDITNGSVLLAKNIDATFPPAGMAKIVTAAVAFEAVRQGRVRLHDTLTVSTNAWKKGGAQSGATSMFASPNSQISVADLLRGLIVASGTDAAITLAEGLAGSEAAFVKQMNAYAARIGMKASRFTNATGLPEAGMVVTARDLARLGEHVLGTYPQLARIFSEKEFTWNKVRQYNRNPLLRKTSHGEGFKTGYTKQSGYGLLGVTNNAGHRLIMVISGLRSGNSRLRTADRLANWGYEGFLRTKLFDAGEVVGAAKVFGGARAQVPLTPGKAFYMLVTRQQQRTPKARISYKGPVRAPIAIGDRIGWLEIKHNDGRTQRVPLFAAEAIASGTLLQRSADSLSELGVTLWRAIARRVGLYPDSEA